MNLMIHSPGLVHHAMPPGRPSSFIKLYSWKTFLQMVFIYTPLIVNYGISLESKVSIQKFQIGSH